MPYAMNAPMAALWVCGLVSGALLVRALVGDRSRGRRRCPKCWYDMSAKPGLECPECGKNVQIEQDYFRSRRSKVALAASLWPVVLAVSVYGVWLSSQPDWLARGPNVMQILLSPWMASDMRHMREYADAYDRMSTELTPRERWFARRYSRFVVHNSSDLGRVVTHVWLLNLLGDVDESVTAAVVAVGREHRTLADADGTVSALSSLPPTPESLALMTELADLGVTESRDVRWRFLYALANVNQQGPRGPPPKLALNAAADGADPWLAGWAISLLGAYDQTEETMKVLLDASASVDPTIRAQALAALSRYAHDDDETRAAIVRALGDTSLGVQRAGGAAGVIACDGFFIDESGEISDVRRRLYRDAALRAALIDAMNAGEGAMLPEWVPYHDALKVHPCFTPEERARVR